MISRDRHRLWDYLASATLILSPLFFGFSSISSATLVFLLTGSAILVYSYLTDYLFIMGRPVPYSLHRVLDVVTAVFLAVAPTLFDYRAFLSPVQEAIHYAIALGLLFLVLLTKHSVRGDQFEVKPEGPKRDTETDRDRAA